MLHGIIRAATAALVFVIAVLVYINYIHSNDTVLPTNSDVASAPEVPKVPVLPEAGPAAPLPLTGSAPATISDAPLAQTVPLNDVKSDRQTASTKAPAATKQRAEILDGELAEVVELPPSNRNHGGAMASNAVQMAAPKPQTGKRTHVVQPGESLWVISKKYLGNGELNGKIAECNGLTSRDKIKVGQLLIIPDGNSTILARVERVSEDLADDDDARRVTKVSKASENDGPALMNSSVRNKF